MAIKPSRDQKLLSTERDASFEQVGKLIDELTLRRQAQSRDGDDDGEEATMQLIHRDREVRNDLRLAKIKVIDDSEEVKNLVVEFKAVNKDLKEATDELKKLAEDMEKAAKAIGVLEKVMTKVATSGAA